MITHLPAARAALRYRLDIIRDGIHMPPAPWSRYHMITDAGLDKVANVSWCRCVSFPILGTGVSPTPVRRDSGAVTFTQSGNTLTASASFFSAADVGRLFKWGTGSAGAEQYITGYTSETQVTVSTSATVGSPAAATVWYVNTDTLQTPITGLTWSKNSDPAENKTTAAVNGDTCTVTHQVVFYSSSLGSAKTVTEIAFSDSTTNAALFDRDILSPSVALLAGDQAKVTVQLVVKWSPVTPIAAANVATGYDSSGDAQFESLKSGISTIHFAGAPENEYWACLEPSGKTTAFLATSALALAPFNFTTMPDSTTAAGKEIWADTYGTGTRFRDVSGTFTISEGNGTIYGCGIGDWNIKNRRMFTIRYTTPHTKTASQTLSLTFRKSWGRVLTN